jgi:LysM repeat protein
MPNARRARAVAGAVLLALTVSLVSGEYTVQRGDTLTEIAGDHDVSVSDLIEANDLHDPDLIRVGQVLVIPTDDQVHVVSRGETLVRIASSYGISAFAVARANSLSDPDRIFPGQRLVIPSGKSGGSNGSDGESEGSTTKASRVRSGDYHIVKRGETLESIAKKYRGVSAEDIARANGIIGGKVSTGTRLFLDGPSIIGGDGGSGSGSYEVRGGDRLGDIAARYGTTITKLAQLNDIEDVNRIRSGQVLTVPGGSGWVCPVKNARYFNDWGFPRGSGRFHEGNDLFTKYGAAVRAPVSGTVDVVRGVLGGLQVNLHGSDGIEYLGSHLDSVGETGKVKAGDVIGYVGTSGNAQGTSPHLHFGMYYKGLAFNPYPTLRANDC